MTTNTQNYNRFSYVLNNPLKYTDPSGYIVNGGNNVFFNSYNLHAGMISKEREWWDNNLDKACHRGDYALIGGFGGTNATFAIGGSVLNVGSVAGGFLGDGSMLTQQGKDFVKSHTGSTPVNKDGVWGSWQDGHYYEHHNYTMEFKEGEFTSFNTMALVTTSRFVPFSDSYSGNQYSEQNRREEQVEYAKSNNFNYANHNEVQSVMVSSTKGYGPIFGGSIGFGIISTAPKSGLFCFGGTFIYAIIMNYKTNLYTSWYHDYLEHGEQSGIYYKDFYTFSKDQITVYREIINGNGAGYRRVQP